MVEETWRAKAKCRNMDTEIFFPGRGEDLRPAQNVCRGSDDSPGECPVRHECLEYALALPYGDDSSGIFGGLSQKERKRIRSNRVRARRVVNGKLAG